MTLAAALGDVPASKPIVTRRGFVMWWVGGQEKRGGGM